MPASVTSNGSRAEPRQGTSPGAGGERAARRIPDGPARTIRRAPSGDDPAARVDGALPARRRRADRKSTRLNSSHSQISYAVFCLKKKKKKMNYITCLKRTTSF